MTMEFELDTLQQLAAAENDQAPCGLISCFMITSGPWK
jgi:hypothetical protein